MKLKRIIEQSEVAAQYYDLGKDFFSFTHAMDMADETVKSKFEQAISAKIKGKKIRARASRGYKQFEKDYDIDAINVSLDDYYDNYVVVVKDPKGKEYFLKPGFKVQVIGQIEQQQQQQQDPQGLTQQPTVPQPQQPSKGGQGSQQTAPSTLPQSQAQTQPDPKNQLAVEPQQSQTPEPEPDASKKKVQENERGTEILGKYPIEKIENDLKRWLLPLLINKNVNLKSFIPREGMTKIKGRSTQVSYGVAIPTDEIPALTVDQIKQSLSQIQTTGNIQDIYKLDKFDLRNGKYIIIIKKSSLY